MHYPQIFLEWSQNISFAFQNKLGNKLFCLIIQYNLHILAFPNSQIAIFLNICFLYISYTNDCILQHSLFFLPQKIVQRFFLKRVVQLINEINIYFITSEIHIREIYSKFGYETILFDCWRATYQPNLSIFIDIEAKSTPGTIKILLPLKIMILCI